MVVFEVDDLDLRAVGQSEMGDVGLPALVGQRRFEADEAGLRTLLGLGSDKAPAHEDPPDGRGRRRRMTVALEVPGDGLRPGVEPTLAQPFPQTDDLVFDLVGRTRRAVMRTPRSGFEGGVAVSPVAPDQGCDPGLGHPVGPGHLSHRATLDHDGIGHVAGLLHGHPLLARCPRCPATSRPLCDGRQHHSLRFVVVGAWGLFFAQIAVAGPVRRPVVRGKGTYADDDRGAPLANGHGHRHGSDLGPLGGPGASSRIHPARGLRQTSLRGRSRCRAFTGSPRWPPPVGPEPGCRTTHTLRRTTPAGRSSAGRRRWRAATARPGASPVA